MDPSCLAHHIAGTSDENLRLDQRRAQKRVGGAGGMQARLEHGRHVRLHLSPYRAVVGGEAAEGKDDDHLVRAMASMVVRVSAGPLGP